MSVFTDVRIVNFSPDQTYKNLVNFLNQLETRKIIRVKIKESEEPSHIRIKMGVSSLDIKLVPQNGNSRIEFIFDFTLQLNGIWFIQTRNTGHVKVSDVQTANWLHLNTKYYY